MFTSLSMVGTNRIQKHFKIILLTQSDGGGGARPLVIQGDQINMVVFFWYLVKSDLSCTRVHTIAITGQVTFYRVPEKHGNVSPCI